ncbi:hypothetical protein ACFSMW_13995 [Virgibacillus halophilus]|uniref:YfhD-like protein n=1 Tax=Tigheibacillus halophilus TaxID=361280 RepID=A0ABU5C253_9BACI|nr:hypothetical protein [Virgibacillus halophilus]
MTEQNSRSAIWKTAPDKKTERKLNKQEDQKFNDDFPVEELNIAMKQEKNKTKSQEDSSTDRDPKHEKN